jgi:hypothetical protein
MTYNDDFETDYVRSGRIGVGWGNSGGEAGGLLTDSYLAADGIENVIRVLEDLEDQKFGELDFIELNACSGGCVGGVLNVENPYVAQAKLKKLCKYLPVARNHINGEYLERAFWDEPIEYTPVFKLGKTFAESFDKMQTAELNIFNRCEKGFDKMPFHKEVRIANRRAQICYEYGPEDVEQDDIEDPLPYDMEAPVVEIKDEWYAEWYRDINENPQNYEGKTLQLRVRIAMIDELPKGKYAMGRHVMTCCVEDIQFAGLVYVYDKPLDVKKGDWVMIKGTVKNEFEQAYQEEGPVIYCEKAWKTKAPDPEVATF